MKSFLKIDRHVGYLLTAFAFLAAVVSPGLLVANASADVLQSRSIQLSTASPDATSVKYLVSFDASDNASGSAAAFIVDFCSESPLLGSTCTAQ
jgi:hypothetical protein